MNDYGTEDFRVVVAIDFGTSRSGYAWAWKGDGKIQGRVKWPGMNVFYPKTPTHLLYDNAGNLLAWGAKVPNVLTQYRQKKSETYFFENFKMELYHQKSDNPVLVNKGKKFRVIDLIADFIRKLKEEVLSNLDKITNGTTYASEIRWLLTVPAIWTDSNKQLMREAAINAGLISDNPYDKHRLIFALEPEAGAIYCQEHYDKRNFLDEGNRFIVVDCGGGTVDITIHEKTVKGLLEVGKGVGGAHGSKYVDKSFRRYLSRIDVLTPEAMEKFIRLHPDAFQKMMEEWETIKCGYELDDKDTLITMPSEMRDLLVKEYPSVLKKLAAIQTGDDRYILIPERVMQNEIFKPTLDKVIDLVRQILYKASYCDYMFLVGGFATSPLLQQRIKEVFSTRMNGNIIIPQVPGAAIVEGAVSFGQDLSKFPIRIARLTYGVSQCSIFEEGVDPEEKRKYYEDQGDYYCEDRFCRYVKVDHPIDIDHEVVHTFFPMTNDQTKVIFRIYATKKTNLRYIDENGSEKVGQIQVEMPDTKGGINRQIKCTMYFGRTEIDVHAEDLTSGSKVKTTLDFSYDYSGG